jgi:hypothetical protein
MNRPTHRRWTAIGTVLAVSLGLSACSTPMHNNAGAGGGATPKAMAACRARADEVYTMQNPTAVYRADMLAAGQRDTPYAGLGLAGMPSDGLSARYNREQLIDDCLAGMASSPTSDIGNGPAPATSVVGSPPAKEPLAVPPGMAAPRR